MGKRLTHREFINKMDVINPTLTILGEYRGTKKKILVKDSLGIKYIPSGASLLLGKSPTIKVAENKTEAFKVMLHEVQPNVYVIGEYVDNRTAILIKYKFGILHNVIPESLLRGSVPTIMSAVDKTEAFKIMLKRVQPKLKVLGEYVGEEHSKILVGDEVGATYTMDISSLLLGVKPSIQSAVNKTEAFKTKLKLALPDIKVLGEYVNATSSILVSDSDGIIYLSNTSSILAGKHPTIKTAIDKNKAFEIKARKIHGGKYNYSKVEYVKTTQNVEIYCKKCQKYFPQSPDSHLADHGCPICNTGKDAPHNVARTKTTEWFKGELEAIQPDLVVVGEYESSHTCILLRDIDGVEYMSRPSNLLNAKKPSIQSAVDKNQAFENKARKVHKDLYNYSLVDYQNGDTEVEIICKDHGSFFQKPNIHLAGSGCQVCNNIFGATAEGWVALANRSVSFDSYKLYLIEIYGNGERFIKVGISYTTIKKRYNKKDSVADYSYKVIKIKERFDDIGGIDIFNLEQEVHAIYGEFYHLPQHNFGGWTECYGMEVKDELISEYFS